MVMVSKLTFSQVAPVLWNALPAEIPEIPYALTFPWTLHQNLLLHLLCCFSGIIFLCILSLYLYYYVFNYAVQF